MTGLRLMVYDQTCRGGFLRPGLSHAWWAGGHLYRGLGRFDAWMGVASWRQALTFLAEIEPSRSIGEVQYWGHGKWGTAKVGEEGLDAAVLNPSHELHELLGRVRDRFEPGGGGLWWFRTCETAGAHRGRAFVRGLADFLGARVAGHTYIIGLWQSGTHCVAPGGQPRWAPTEGLARGTADEPQAARRSNPFAPSTVNCLQGALPDSAF